LRCESGIFKKEMTTENFTDFKNTDFSKTVILTLNKQLLKNSIFYTSSSLSEVLRGWER
jgi:hypothetical protein